MHYFATTASHWRASEDLVDVILSLAQVTSSGENYIIFRVPLPIDANYVINNYKPVVDGIEEVARGRFQ